MRSEPLSDTPMAPPGQRDWRIVAPLAALAYLLVAYLSFLFAPIDVVSWVWPASGVAFAAIWLFRRPALVGIFVASFAIELWRSGSPLFSALIACGSLLPALSTLFLLRRAPLDNLFDSPDHVFRFIAYAGVLGPFGSALLGAAATALSGLEGWPMFARNVRSWWFGDAIGILLFAPPLLTLSLWRELRWTWPRRLELLGLAIGVVLYCALLSQVNRLLGGIPVSLLIVPLVIWGALRFNFAVGSVVVMLVALWSMVGAAYSAQTHVVSDPALNMLYVQIFLATTACISLAVGATIAAQSAAIAAQRATLRQLRDSEDRFRATFEQAAMGVAIIGLDKRWLMINQRLCDILGYSRAELLQFATPEALLFDGEQIREGESERLSGSEFEQYRTDKRLARKNGATIWCSLYATVVCDDAGSAKYYAVMVEDISERKRAEAAVERMALYDALTRLPNRRLLLDRLKQALPAARRNRAFGAVLFIDLDRFKVLNDAHGHGVGDLLLIQAAARMQDMVRAEDTVARLAGDEFVVLLQNLDGEEGAATADASSIAENLRQVLQAPFRLGDLTHHISASIGVTLFPKDGDAPEDLLKEADIAMYRAKQRGANDVCFYAPEMQAAAELRLSLERALRLAIAENQLRLYLQPQVNSEREIVGAEALLRWFHPERGMIAPSAFIPVAEDSGLIVEIGAWVLRAAAELAWRINRQQRDISISVNVSPRQFRERDFVDKVRRIMVEVGADPRQMVLEITEGVVISDFADTIQKMSELQEMGFRLSIDDFGTGYSSLVYLKRLPLGELKIDRSFVADLPDDASDVMLVETILSTAQHFGLKVVAEGVETAAQFEFLRRRNCLLYQGYYFGYPDEPARYFPFLGNNAQLG